ncbi:internalin I isoform X2 [Solenopsis invicta]|uniref:internalin I isoform X2 n=1 Tax=Solenopsis invicta TaxID=13686 RepID=UPI00193CD42C|nr:internalin I isoform X2 [Solenopsis invicta]
MIDRKALIILLEPFYHYFKVMIFSFCLGFYISYLLFCYICVYQAHYYYVYSSDTNDEVKYSLEVEKIEEYTMTCLGALIFADKYSRQSSTPNDSSKKQIDSLSLAYEDLYTMPYNIIQDYSLTVQHLDISNNMFSRNLQFLSEFDNLRSVNLDHNKIDDITVFPNMPNLELLWLNHNRIKNLLYVLSWFPHLVHLDDRTVTKQQLLQAKKLFRRSVLEDFVAVPECIKDMHNKIAVYPNPPVSDKQRVLGGTNLVV